MLHQNFVRVYLMLGHTGQHFATCKLSRGAGGREGGGREAERGGGGGEEEGERDAGRRSRCELLSLVKESRGAL